jgi:glycosyltransferase involved in cell wall biosynthesis
MFYGFPSDRFEAQPGDAAAALADLVDHSDKRICFHVHWLNFLYKEADTQSQSNATFDRFLAACRAIRENGGVVAWTVHNAVEHEATDKDFEINFRRQLAQIADVIVVHGKQAEVLATTTFNAPPQRVINVVHGSYIGAYVDEIDRDVARKRLNAPARETIFANVGAIRPYKGLNELITSILEIDQEGVSVGLLLAGRALPAYADELTTMTGRSAAVRLDPRRVLDDEMQLYLNAADFLVLPYRSILTSGSAILGLSFARPIVAPALGCLTDLIEDGVNGFLYEPAMADGLVTALKRAARTDAKTRARMSQAAFARATTLRWSDARSAFIQAISSEL